VLDDAEHRSDRLEIGLGDSQETEFITRLLSLLVLPESEDRVINAGIAIFEQSDHRERHARTRLPGLAVHLIVEVHAHQLCEVIWGDRNVEAARHLPALRVLVEAMAGREKEILADERTRSPPFTSDVSRIFVRAIESLGQVREPLQLSDGALVLVDEFTRDAEVALVQFDVLRNVATGGKQDVLELGIDLTKLPGKPFLSAQQFLHLGFVLAGLRQDFGGARSGECIRFQEEHGKTSLMSHNRLARNPASVFAPFAGGKEGTGVRTAIRPEP